MIAGEEVILVISVLFQSGKDGFLLLFRHALHLVKNAVISSYDVYGLNAQRFNDAGGHLGSDALELRAGKIMNEIVLILNSHLLKAFNVELHAVTRMFGIIAVQFIFDFPVHFREISGYHHFIFASIRQLKNGYGVAIGVMIDGLDKVSGNCHLNKLSALLSMCKSTLQTIESVFAYV